MKILRNKHTVRLIALKKYRHSQQVLFLGYKPPVGNNYNL